MSELLRRATAPELHRGLEGVVVDESSLSTVDGDAGRLTYRGYEIEDLAEHATFEEVLWLLWHGDLPTRDELAAFEDELAGERSVDAAVVDLLRDLADAGETPMAALRTAVSMLSAYDPDRDADPRDQDAAFRQGRRIAAAIPTVLAAYDRLRRGEEPVEPRGDLGTAANFLYQLHGEVPDAVMAEAFDMALTLHADHGLNASTFTTLVIASTYADMYDAVVGGIGALAGPWHGGANQDVMRALFDIHDGDRDPIAWAQSVLDEGERVPGWGHRVYNVRDPRAVILQARSEAIADATGDRTFYEYTRAIDDYLVDEVGLPEKGIAPNVDFYSGTVYHQLGIPLDLFTPIFAMSRVGGWVAHVLEYREENRLIRPRSRYVGPDHRDWVPLDER